MGCRRDVCKFILAKLLAVPHFCSLSFVNPNEHTKLVIRTEGAGLRQLGMHCCIPLDQNSRGSTSDFNTEGKGVISKSSKS